LVGEKIILSNQLEFQVRSDLMKKVREFNKKTSTPFPTTYETIKLPGRDELFVSLETDYIESPPEDLQLKTFEKVPSKEFEELNQGFHPKASFETVQQKIIQQEIPKNLMDFTRQPFHFDNQYPAIKPQGFIPSEIQGKLQTPPTNFSPSNQEVSMNLLKQIDKSFKVNKNPTNLSEMDPEITKNKTVPKRFPIPKISPRNIFKKKSKETEQIEKDQKIKEMFHVKKEPNKI
jgi:hypothetical protein